MGVKKKMKDKPVKSMEEKTQHPGSGQLELLSSQKLDEGWSGLLTTISDGREGS